MAIKYLLLQPQLLLVLRIRYLSRKSNCKKHYV